MDPVLRISGRVLFLSANPSVVRAQLAGQSFNLQTAGELRDEISTDEISPMASLVYFDDRLGLYPYTGFTAGDDKPIGKGGIKHGGYGVTVAGNRYGKGSSREHSPLAEKMAGIRLVIAKSFERIYRQNADNIGLLTSTDFGLLESIANGESIAIEQLVASRDAVSREIILAGGLLGFGQTKMQGLKLISLPAPTKPQTLFEKIVARHTLSEHGEGLLVKPDLRYIHDIYTAMCGHMLEGAFGANYGLHESGSVLAFEDHYSYTHQSPMHVGLNLLPDLRLLSDAHRAFVAKHDIVHYGYLDETPKSTTDASGGSQGISHAIVAEKYALPGQLIAATDSHTPHSGALGCVAFGIGTTDMANALVTGAVRMAKPKQMQIKLHGQLPEGVTAKDVMLHLLALPAIRGGVAVGKVVEFTGSVSAALSVDARATLTNMCAELGAFTGLFAPDRETERFLSERRRGLDFKIEPWMRSDDGAWFDETITLDCSHLSPIVAAPGDPGHGIALDAIAHEVRVDIAYGGSCTAGKRDDFDQYHAVLAWALANGRRVEPHVTLYLQFGTVDVRDYCERMGYLETFEAVGATLLQPACGACANCGPGVSTNKDQITVSAINRNFAGRGGPGGVWLASPYTVAASAIAGRLCSFDSLRASK